MLWRISLASPFTSSSTFAPHRLEEKKKAEDAPVSVLCARHRLRQRRQSVPRRREVDIASAKHLRQIKYQMVTGGECSERLF